VVEGVVGEGGSGGMGVGRGGVMMMVRGMRISEG